MKPSLEDGLRALREASEQSASIRIELDAEYLRAIAIAEALPEHQSGPDKSWVWRMEHSFREHFKRARPL